MTQEVDIKCFGNPDTDLPYVKVFFRDNTYCLHRRDGPGSAGLRCLTKGDTLQLRCIALLSAELIYECMINGGTITKETHPRLINFWEFIDGLKDINDIFQNTCNLINSHLTMFDAYKRNGY